MTKSVWGCTEPNLNSHYPNNARKHIGTSTWKFCLSREIHGKLLYMKSLHFSLRDCYIKHSIQIWFLKKLKSAWTFPTWVFTNSIGQSVMQNDTREAVCMPPKKIITTHVPLLRKICLKEGMGDEGRRSVLRCHMVDNHGCFMFVFA